MKDSLGRQADGAVKARDDFAPATWALAPEGAENCVTWADALRKAVGPAPRSGLGGRVVVHPEVG